MDTDDDAGSVDRVGVKETEWMRRVAGWLTGVALSTASSLPARRNRK